MSQKALQKIAPLPVPRTAAPKTALGRWLSSGGKLDEESESHQTHPWYLVLWLTGVDYFSTLGYQPGIALIAAGVISPIATTILILVTLFGALPIYSQVASRSYAGQGSIAMLENLLDGWKSKIFVLILLGFAGTDFVITMTLSAADAAQHAIENPYLHPYLGEARMGITIGLLLLLTIVFLKGFHEAIRVAVAVAIPYLVLNLIVMVRAFIEIAYHPELLNNWRVSLNTYHSDWTMLIIGAGLIFPKLALGLSGFETGVSVMPMVSGSTEDKDKPLPLEKIQATRKLLAAAALIMSVMLIMSSFVTTLLIPETDYKIGGSASGRAIAYLAHRMLGDIFGTIYDLSTIVILWFAGASAMAGLLNLIPRYLPRFGMAPRWISYRRPLVIVLFAISVIITIIFKANVEAQGGAYATGVLVLMLSAAIAVALALWRESHANTNKAKTLFQSFYFWVIAAVFGFTLVDNVIERPDGVIIASVFIIVIILFSAISRYKRATELRVAEISFSDEVSSELWQLLVGKKVHFVPLRTSTDEERTRKTKELRKYYNIIGPMAFIHINLRNNRSEFLSELSLKITKQEENFIIEVFGAVALANTIAYISELIDPISIFIGLTRENLMAQSFKYLLWGEGETGLMVYTILIRYWDWTPAGDVRPLIFLMSD